MNPVPTVRHVEFVMGFPLSVALRGRHARTPEGTDAWNRAVASLRADEAVFSRRREGSWISRLARAEVSREECPDEVREVLDLADRAELDSGGAFAVRRTGPDGRPFLDTDGVVKGWAVERASAALRQLDDTDFCLSGGGDVVCATRPGSPAWRVGIEDPRDTSRLIATWPLADGGIATSGTAHRGQHVVDARTGTAPVTLAQVTVAANSLTEADVDATAAFALDADAARWLRTRPGRTGFLVRCDGTTEVVQGR